MPLYFRFLDHEILGIWFLLGQGASFVIMLDFGISPILQRKVAFAVGELNKNGVQDAHTYIQEKIAKIVVTAGALYRRIIVFSFLVMWLCGLFFLSRIQIHSIEWPVLFLSWSILCIGYAITIFSLLWSSVLYGLGHVGWETLISLISNIALQIALVVGIYFGWELTFLAITTALFAAFSRLIVYITLKRLEPCIIELKPKVDFSILRGWAPFAFKYWVTSVAAFLLLKSDQAFIAYFIDSSAIPKYHAAFQIFTALASIGLALSQASQPFISQSWASGNAVDILAMTRRSLLLALSTVACGASIMLNSGESLFHVWLGPGQYIGYEIVLVFSLMTLLETQHLVFASSARATNFEGFAYMAVAAAVINLVLTYVLVQKYGLIGIAIGTMVAQMLTNNWYVIVVSLRRLKIPLQQYLWWAMLSIGICSATMVVSFAIRIVAQDKLNDVSHVLIQITANAILYVLVIGFFILNKNERLTILRNLSERI